MGEVIDFDAEIARCLREQKHCADLLLSGHPEQAGLWQAVSDWTAEEIVLRAMAARSS